MRILVAMVIPFLKEWVVMLLSIMMILIRQESIFVGFDSFQDRSSFPYKAYYDVISKKSNFKNCVYLLNYHDIRKIW